MFKGLLVDVLLVSWLYFNGKLDFKISLKLYPKKALDTLDNDIEDKLLCGLNKKLFDKFYKILQINFVHNFVILGQ